ERGQRSSAASTNLVWRRGPIGSQHGAVLRLAWQEEERAYSPCCDGPVEAVSGGDGCACAASRDFIRQVPLQASSRRGARSRPQDMRGLRAATDAISKARNTLCSRGGKTSRS